MPSLIKSVVCMACGHSMGHDPLPDKCEKCGSDWLEAQYDYEQAAQLWKAGLTGRVSSLWRYDELLPLSYSSSVVTLGEGWTPLLPTAALGTELEHTPPVY